MFVTHRVVMVTLHAGLDESYVSTFRHHSPSSSIFGAFKYQLIKHSREQGCIFLYNWLQKRDLSMSYSPSFWNSSVLISLFIPLIFLQDLPLGLMDDIYDFISKFAQRIDETEEVKLMFSDYVYFIINKLWMLTL